MILCIKYTKIMCLAKYRFAPYICLKSYIFFNTQIQRYSYNGIATCKYILSISDIKIIKKRYGSPHISL